MTQFAIEEGKDLRSPNKICTKNTIVKIFVPLALCIGIALGVGLGLGLRSSENSKIDSQLTTSISGSTGVQRVSSNEELLNMKRRLLADNCPNGYTLSVIYNPQNGLLTELQVDGATVCSKSVHTLEGGFVLITPSGPWIIQRNSKSVIKLATSVFDGVAIDWTQAKIGRSGTML